MQVLRKPQKMKAPDLPQDQRSPVSWVLIPLTRGFFTKVDTELAPELLKYRWKAVKSKSCWYAVRKEKKFGITHYIRMHRQIANTPIGLETHHTNFDSMDNRRKNLENLTPQIHYHRHLQKHFLEQTQPA